jgi:hypothetical protein
MVIHDGIQLFVLQEFQLWTADAHGAVSRIVSASPPGRESALPLLTSIDDDRNVATLRGFHAGETSETDEAQRAALDPFVASWQVPKEYTPRIAEGSLATPTYYRLAVTESGINEVDNVGTSPRELARDATSTPIGLLWIGSPVGTHAGLLTLLGSYDGPDAVRPHPGDWPLPLTRELGVRIYESRV